MALHCAVESNDITICDALVQNGADLNKADDLGRTPLHLAAAREEGAAMMEWLISKNADVEIRDISGRSPAELGEQQCVPGIRRCPSRANLTYASISNHPRKRSGCNHGVGVGTPEHHRKLGG